MKLKLSKDSKIRKFKYSFSTVVKNWTKILLKKLLKDTITKPLLNFLLAFINIYWIYGAFLQRLGAFSQITIIISFHNFFYVYLFSSMTNFFMSDEWWKFSGLRSSMTFTISFCNCLLHLSYCFIVFSTFTFLLI